MSSKYPIGICSSGCQVEIETPNGGRAQAFFADKNNPHQQNCHGYALGIKAWINNPEDVYAKETIRVSKPENADFIFYTWMNKPWHSAKIKDGRLDQKYGVIPYSTQPRYSESILQKEYYYKLKDK